MPTTVGRLKQGDLLISGQVDERIPAVNNTFKVRYIRDWVDGSTANPGDHWVEIQAFDRTGTNVALSKTVTTNGTVNSGTLSMVTNGDTTSTNYCGIDVAFPVYVQVDLGDYYDLKQIKVWHYYADARTYYGTKTEVSVDGTTWHTVFNSAIHGTYVETSVGKTHYINLNLIGYFPLDGTVTGQSHKRNLLDTSTWIVGTTGSQVGFTQNGTGTENQIIKFTNPWGWEDTTWATLGNDAASDWDGGWDTFGYPIDNTKKYRLSVWIRRENVGNGRTYFGCQPNTVTTLGSSTPDGNPYFFSGLIGEIPEMTDNWTLWVAYIHPNNYAGITDPTTGIYRLDGSKTRSIADYKWTPTATVGGYRTYLYYSSTPSEQERQYWYRPRFEVCDGTEAPIQDLLRGYDDNSYLTVNSNTILNQSSVGLEEAYTNMINNGCFQNKSHVSQVNLAGSYGTYSIVEAPNPMSHISPFVLKQSGGSSAEYEITLTGLAASTTYRLTAWVYHSPDFDGNKQTHHARWYTAAGAESGTTTGQGTVIDSWNGWERRYVQFTTGTDTRSTGEWYLGYPTGGTKGYRLITGIQCVAKGACPSWTDSSTSKGLIAINSSIFTTSGGSMSFWAKRTNPNTTNYKSLYGNVWGGTNAFFSFMNDSTQALYFYYPATDNTHKYVNGSYIPAMDQWVHYTLVWDNASIVLYANGIAIVKLKAHMVLGTVPLILRFFEHNQPIELRTRLKITLTEQFMAVAKQEAIDVKIAL